MFVYPKKVLSSELKCMVLEVVKTDFFDFLSACMLSSKSESEGICYKNQMVLFISTNSYTPGVNSISKILFSIPSSGIFM